MNEIILVVDDEESICQSLKAILSDEGHQVLVAGSGEEAIKIVEEEIDYDENENFNDYWDEQYGEFSMGDYFLS